MKVQPSLPSDRAHLQFRQGAFTLAEIMTATAVFSLLVVALVSSQLLGMRMLNVTATKLSATQMARNVLNHVRQDVLSGKTIEVGAGNNSSFTRTLFGSNQAGNALQIYPTTDTNSFIRYYLDQDNGQLKRLTSGDPTVMVVASFLTNWAAPDQKVFTAEDFMGNPLTNSQNNRVIHMNLSFYQWEFPVAVAGKGGHYDSYQLNTRITRRAIE